MAQQLMDKEMGVAHSIQMGMVPDRFPPFPERKDLDIYARMAPARNIGGDFYDYFIRNEKLFFCIGDVSGKGVPASLLMAMCRTMFRTLSAKESNPQAIVSAMNDGVNELGGRNMFVTLLVGVLDLPTGRLRHCNAGHNPPFVLDADGHGEEMSVKPNMPVGVVRKYSYRQQELNLNAGETLFLYTDGVTEAQDPSGILFGVARLLPVLQEGGTPQELIERVDAAVKAFEAGQAQTDDLTLLAIRYTPVQETVLLERMLTLENRKAEIGRLAGFVEDFAREAGLTTREGLDLNLALEEAVTNVILYSYPEGVKGSVQVEARALSDRLVFVITDQGKAFDPTVVPDVNLKQRNAENRKGGLGIFLVRKIMETVNYEYRDARNILTLTWRRKP